MSRWVQEKKDQQSTSGRRSSARQVREDEEVLPHPGIRFVEEVINSVPAEIISRRAVECRSYARALFHWEQYIRQCRNTSPPQAEQEPLFERLQEIYTQIDEPDGIEGISAHLHILNIDQ